MWISKAWAAPALLLVLAPCMAIAPVRAQSHDARLATALDAYEDGDYARARALLMPLAEAGLAAAQIEIGHMYWSGDGVPQDHARAAHWYRLAAEQGHAYAQFSLASLYEQGSGVTRDLGQALHWYRAAARNGDPAAEEALKKLEPAALRRDTPSMGPGAEGAARTHPVVAPAPDAALLSALPRRATGTSGAQMLLDAADHGQRQRRSQQVAASQARQHAQREARQQQRSALWDGLLSVASVASVAAASAGQDQSPLALATSLAANSGNHADQAQQRLMAGAITALAGGNDSQIRQALGGSGGALRTGSGDADLALQITTGIVSAMAAAEQRPAAVPAYPAVNAAPASTHANVSMQVDNCSAVSQFDTAFDRLRQRYPMQSHWGSRDNLQYTYFMMEIALQLLGQCSAMPATDYQSIQQQVANARDAARNGCNQLSSHGTCAAEYPGEGGGPSPLATGRY